MTPHERGRSRLHNPHSLSHSSQYFQRLLQFVLGMRRRYNRPDACLSFGRGGNRNPRAHYALLEQLAGKVHGEFAVADDDGSDWGFAGRRGLASDVEAQKPPFPFPEASVFPEFLTTLGRSFENIESGDAGGRHRGRMRSREQERAGAVIEKINQVTSATEEAVQQAD